MTEREALENLWFQCSQIAKQGTRMIDSYKLVEASADRISPLAQAMIDARKVLND